MKLIKKALICSVAVAAMSASVVALAAGLTSIRCYNGNSTGGILKLKILSATYRVRMVKFNCPILFDKGLYIHSTIGAVHFFLVYKLAIR